ncbi:MAG: glutamate-5-semialdehyde dehydrogenase [Clostridiaceae bacterium]|nr:glutamate-5-semialdehyde dehydrogenase [Clostridiaceae bacterium]
MTEKNTTERHTKGIVAVRAAAEQCRKASHQLPVLPAETRDKALREVSRALRAAESSIVAANRLDLERAAAEGLAAPLLARLNFDHKKLTEVCTGLDELAELPDLLNERTLARELAPGLELYRERCPIGVIGFIFESRPDALVQIAALAIRSGNAAIVKGGSEARETNRELFRIIKEASEATGLPEGWLANLESRAEIQAILKLDEYIDLIIPRGSNQFVQYIMANSNIPVLGHADGVCHTYISADCDREMALKVVFDAKTQYVSVCNATETILIDPELTGSFLTDLVAGLRERGVEIYGDWLLCLEHDAKSATDWHTEYLDYKVAIHVVADLDGAIEHINKYGSGHTDAIITSDRGKAEEFMNRVDSGNVFWNCSTRFSDGFRYGFGAEVGIATSKIHARGPVGVDGLLTYKYKLYGQGDIVGDFSSGKRKFTHRDLN